MMSLRSIAKSIMNAESHEEAEKILHKHSVNILARAQKRVSKAMKDPEIAVYSGDAELDKRIKANGKAILKHLKRTPATGPELSALYTHRFGGCIHVLRKKHNIKTTHIKGGVYLYTYKGQK
jgi:hypothetical protein